MNNANIIKLDHNNINAYLEDIEQLEQQCFGQLAWNKKQIIDELDNTFSVIVAYIIGTQAVAYANARIVVDELQIGNIAVLPNYQKQGIGSRVLDYLIDLARTNSCVAVQLEVAVDNSPAIALYNKAHFVTVGLRKKFYTTSNGSKDAYTMTLTL